MLQQLENRIRELVPSLMELSPGCEFDWYSEELEEVRYIVAKIYSTEDVLSGVSGFSMYAWQKEDNHPQMISFDNPYDYEEQEATFFDYATILGHPIQLNHVLQAIEVVDKYPKIGLHTSGTFIKGGINTEFNIDLLKPFKEWDEKVHAFLWEILKP